MSKPEMLLWLSDARGQYIPRDFARSFIDRDKNVFGVTEEQWTVLESGPEGWNYWEVWDEVLNDAAVTDEHGVTYTLHQDGALWLIPEGMVWDDRTETFCWEEDKEEEENEHE